MPTSLLALRVLLRSLIRSRVSDGLAGFWLGRWTGVAPDGSPILRRDLSIQEIYALDVDLP